MQDDYPQAIPGEWVIPEGPLETTWPGSAPTFSIRAMDEEDRPDWMGQPGDTSKPKLPVSGLHAVLKNARNTIVFSVTTTWPVNYELNYTWPPGQTNE